MAFALQSADLSLNSKTLATSAPPSDASTTEEDTASVHSSVDQPSTLFPGTDYSMLAKIPVELLTARTQESQDLRLRLLKGSTIVFYGTGYPGKRFIYERAHDLGVNVVLVDQPDAWCNSLVEEGKAFKFIPIDIMSPDQDEVCEETVAALKQLDRIDGICTFYELCLQTMSKIGEALGLRCASEKSIMTARDKYAARQALKRAGLPSVENYLIKSEEDLDAAAKAVGFPAVLKPLCGSASQGVKKVSSMDDLRKTYKETYDLIANMVVVDGEFSEDVGDLSGGPKVQFGGFMLEEYLDGAEVDIDTVMCNGKCVYAAVHDNGPTVEPYFMETWDVMPSMLANDEVEGLRQMAVDSVSAMGFSDGVFHVEGKYTSRGPKLIEVNARLGGGPVHMMNKIANGVDLVDEELLLSVGIPSVPVMLPFDQRYAIACSTINALKSGKISDLSFTRQWDHMEGVEVVSNNTLISEGEHIVGPEEGQPTWLADLIFKAPLKDLQKVGSLAIKLDKEAAQEFLKHYDC
ncbi:Carnosine synthase 1 [Perkinsus chesapeaki]|uniref:Carnosine synthase 1 n=1 Tax=Perkinsus chesapeaki TaxID=330153 RepID=A0A7J6ME19_PERCH|nr:Carnosine synthase 1 [Perkinsus chesapeaki]